jgi:predicted nucleic-acid-binding protein
VKGLDTNILVRFLVGDDAEQAEKVYLVFKQAEAEKQQLLVPLVVVLELLWVLESVYAISREEILDSLGDLALMPIMKFEQLSVLQEFLRVAPGNTVDLSDLLIACAAKGMGCETVLTFDRKAAGYKMFELVG